MQNEIDGHPLTKVETVVLEDFEKAVYAGEHELATVKLRDCLRAQRHGLPFAGYDMGSREIAHRLASGITALWSHPKFRLSQPGFDNLAVEYAVIDGIFKASGFGSADHLIRLIRDDSVGLNKYLLTFGLDSELDLDFETPFRKSPEATVGLYLGMLGHWMVFSERSHERRNRLIEMCDLFEDIEVRPETLNAMCSAYMHLSYADHPQKHRPKRVIHNMLARFMAAGGQGARATPLPWKERPTILMPVEWWWTHHVMYRDFGEVVKTLKERFRLIGMGRDGNTNEEARAVFDEFITVGEPVYLVDVAQKIRSLSPDIIFYPSIGMSVWTMAMASLRLAPIQVMAYGHPATANSPEIDYGIAFDEDADQSLHREEVIALASPHSRRFFNLPKKRHEPTRGGPVRIGVAAMQAKVSWPFIRCLREVQRRADRTVEFHFFPPLNGTLMYQFGRQVERLLKNTIVCEKINNEQYLEWLGECDIATFSFPFGGSNSTLDAMLLGLPMVGMEGKELHARMDSTLMRRAGLPEWLIARNESEYVEALLKLMDDDVRADVASQVRAIDMERTFFNVGGGNGRFLDAFLDIYERGHAVERKVA